MHRTSDMKQYARERKLRLMKEGKCVACKKKREPWRRNVGLCEGCAEKQKEYTKHRQGSLKNLPADEVAFLELPTQYREKRACMRCGRKFDSPDKRHIKHCGGCRYWMTRTVETLACEPEAYDSGEDDETTMTAVYVQTRITMGRMNRYKQEELREVRQEEDYAGVPFIRLTKAQIKAEYTEERLDRLYAQMRACVSPVLYDGGRRL